MPNSENPLLDQKKPKKELLGLDTSGVDQPPGPPGGPPVEPPLKADVQSEPSMLDEVMAEARREGDSLSDDIASRNRADAIKRLMKVDRNLLRELRESGELDQMDVGEINQLGIEQGLEHDRLTRESDESDQGFSEARDLGFHKTPDEEYRERGDAAYETWRQLVGVVNELKGTKIGWFAKIKFKGKIPTAGGDIAAQKKFGLDDGMSAGDGIKSFHGSMEGLEMTNEMKAEDYFTKKNNNEGLALLDEYDRLMGEYRAHVLDMSSGGGVDRIGVASAESFDIGKHEGIGDYQEAAFDESAQDVREHAAGPATVETPAVSDADLVEATPTLRDMPSVEGELSDADLVEATPTVQDIPAAPRTETHPYVPVDRTPTLMDVEPADSQFATAETEMDFVTSDTLAAVPSETETGTERDMEAAKLPRATEEYVDYAAVERKAKRRDKEASARAAERAFQAILAESQSVIREIPMDSDAKKLLMNDTYFAHRIQDHMDNAGNVDVARVATDYKEYLEEWFNFHKLLNSNGRLRKSSVRVAEKAGVSRARIDDQYTLLVQMDDLIDQSIGNTVSVSRMKGASGGRRVARLDRENKQVSAEPFNPPVEVEGREVPPPLPGDKESVESIPVPDAEIELVADAMMSTDDVIDLIDDLKMDSKLKLGLYDARFMDIVAESGQDVFAILNKAQKLSNETLKPNLFEKYGAKFTLINPGLRGSDEGINFGIENKLD
ncbi:MAG: hypothetical protein CMI52_05145, partial [Parcubacteria group bacterium]|nr:hypothetical protein [Parcubacteria group bacterium]